MYFLLPISAVNRAVPAVSRHRTQTLEGRRNDHLCIGLYYFVFWQIFSNKRFFFYLILYTYSKFYQVPIIFFFQGRSYRSSHLFESIPWWFIYFCCFLFLKSFICFQIHSIFDFFFFFTLLYDVFFQLINYISQCKFLMYISSNAQRDQQISEQQ